MSQVLPRRVGEEATKSLGGFTKMLQQTLITNTSLFNHPDDYLCRRLKISQLLGFLIMISRQLFDLLHILDHLLVRVSLDLGQLLQSICLVIHNIGQASHHLTFSQQQAFKLFKARRTLAPKSYLKNTSSSKKEKNTFLLLGEGLFLFLQLGGPILKSRIVLLQSFDPGL
jgi:hypothetical protein